MSAVDDFSGQDLRNRSFLGQELAGASFRNADLRGADFSRANLKNADFTGARTGMQRTWALLLGLGALVSSILLGLLAGWSGHLLQGLITSDAPARRLLGVLLVVELAVFVGVSIWRGYRFAARRVLPVVAVLALLGGVIAAVAGGRPTGVGLAIVALTLLVVALIVLASFARLLGGALGSLFFFVVAVSGALAGRLAGGGLIAMAMAVAAMLSARRAIAGAPQYRGLERIGAAAACAKGTRFKDADLTQATFSSTKLSTCDFRGAHLDGSSGSGARIKLCLFDTAPDW